MYRLVERCLRFCNTKPVHVNIDKCFSRLWESASARPASRLGLVQSSANHRRPISEQTALAGQTDRPPDCRKPWQFIVNTPRVHTHKSKVFRTSQVGGQFIRRGDEPLAPMVVQWSGDVATIPTTRYRIPPGLLMSKRRFSLEAIDFLEAGLSDIQWDRYAYSFQQSSRFVKRA
ncbi:unnamed protein product [Protopolystoma xenopodis]|uniref:Uncharacterized protein n=1 Tax=Protopolystoma xenopodis TaxID=117903 RepID=A0A448XG16_9PLAT|nr:unnamed protein product [Protopolystoma xenopodis]